MENLPIELLHYIASFLPLRNLPALMLLNKRFSRVFDSEIFWYRYLLYRFPRWLIGKDCKGITKILSTNIYANIERYKYDPALLQSEAEWNKEWFIPDVLIPVVQYRADALLWLGEKQTEEACMAAVKQDWRALHFVRNQTPEMCLEALNKTNEIFFCIKDKKHVFLHALKSGPVGKGWGMTRVCLQFSFGGVWMLFVGAMLYYYPMTALMSMTPLYMILYCAVKN